MPKTAQTDRRHRRTVDGGEDQLVREGDIAGDYLERLLDVLDYDGDIDLDVEAGRAIVSIDGGEDLDKLVGDRGRGAGGAAGADPPRRPAVARATAAG